MKSLREERAMSKSFIRHISDVVELRYKLKISEITPNILVTSHFGFGVNSQICKS